jgi:predicted nucleotidyltransferase
MRHHEETIAGYATRAAAEPDVLALVVVGSVARAAERSTSDVDVYLVVTDEAYAAGEAAGRVAYIDTDAATYDSYVDIKLASPRYLERAVANADDPTRASFLQARTVFDRTGLVTATIARIVTLPEQVWQRRVHAYRCQARLYGGYFLKQAHERNDGFLLQHSAVHLCLAVGRVALAVNRTLFQGQKYLAATLPQLAELPDGFLAAWRNVLKNRTPEGAAALIDLVDAWQGGPLSLEDALSTFIINNELGWLNGTVPPEFW